MAMRKTEQVKNLKNGRGIQYLLDEAYQIFGNPISVFDTDYDKIAYTDVESDDRFWNELIETGTYGEEAQLFFMNEYFTDEVANAEKLAVMKSDKLKYERVLGHIYNGDGIKVANVFMIAHSHPFDPETFAAFELFADLLSMEIRHDEAYIAYGEAYQSKWIKKLIDSDFKEKRLYSPHVQILYDGFKENLYAAVVDVSRGAAKQNGPQAYVDLFRPLRRDCKYAVYGGYAVILLSTRHKTFHWQKELHGLIDSIESENLLVGVSRCFGNLFALRDYYEEAVRALNGRQPGDSRHIYLSEE